MPRLNKRNRVRACETQDCQNGQKSVPCDFVEGKRPASSDRPVLYEEIERTNEAFFLYYKMQRIVPEEEWDTFAKTLATNLPVAFRITGFRPEADAIRHIMKMVYFPGLKRILPVRDNLDNTAEDLDVVPRPLPWYPNELAWQVNLTRQMIRRNAELAKLHHFLISETVCGAISRQEAVSMIPPLVMDVRPDHKVLDMCAAPGSKTTQLLEMLHADEGKPAEGMVVANDADNKRCYMLVTQAKRLNSPNLIVINHDASNLPNMWETARDGSKVPLKFDRILCDVPCSGDGTMRKNVDVWKKWNGANGNNLHWLQFRIARRGLQLLKVGGLMVYSTCSLNPVEDEAILCRLMKEYPGCLELVEVSDRVPGLKYAPGVTYWKPMSRDKKFYEKPEEVPESFQSQIRAAMFPPSKDEVENFHLERCLRILPHYQDTGGFFLAVIKKLMPLKSAEKQEKAEKGTEVTSACEYGETNVEEERKSPPKKRRFFGFREDPFVYFKEEEPTWQQIQTFFGVEGLDPTILLSRSREAKKKNVYLTSASVKDFLINNEESLKIINTGIKVFIRCDGKNTGCDFRIAQEGASEILRYLKKRIITLEREDALAILRKHDLEDPLQNSALTEKAQAQLREISTGSVAFIHKSEIPEAKQKREMTLVMVGWKGKDTVRAYVAKNDRVHLLRLCGGDTTFFENIDIEAKFGNKPSVGQANGDAPSENGADEHVEDENGDTPVLQESEVSLETAQPAAAVQES